MEEENIHITDSGPEEVVLLKYIHDEVSEKERRWVECWLKEDETRNDILLQLASIDYALYTKQRIESRNSLEAYSKVEKHIRLRQTKKWIRCACFVAACFLGVLIFSTAISYWKWEPSKIEKQIITVRANAGMRTSLNLPDGTVAYLNSGTILSYPLSYDKKERRVTLTGEAYFKVAHNLEQPFIVSVANDRMRVKVLGTEFNLQSYEDEKIVQTTLVLGSVNIEMIEKGNVVSEVDLKPSEKAVYDVTSGIVSVAKVNTEYDTAWIDGRLMFKDMPLPEVLKKLAYFYNVRFEVKDSVINSYRFTGTFDNKQLSQVLDYLRISSRIQYTIDHIKLDDSLKVQHTTVVLRAE
ncbi:FecR family protein [Parabacteroides faecis]|uniref:Ferric-dicitrate binding protein FerR (Iron transport regulator) n=1 Tax=Parabacteroides faecis TaxID=1217282 RepID=A0ABR6KMR0_9BACT|nr:FecR domain-containing protein [Parabacteroides faecis]MBB4622775.1 ferric-dicitrate binding protein FerR (iron transport regulator) [Parabacteroides faecis]GGJ95020.1 anti-sigma factor [Parabacteroides faecis]